MHATRYHMHATARICRLYLEYLSVATTPKHRIFSYVYLSGTTL